MIDDDDMPDLPEMPELDGLLSAYRAETARSSAQVDAALQAVSRHVGAAGAGTAAATGLSTTAKVGLASALLGVAGVVGLALDRPEASAPMPTPAPAVASSPAVEPAPEPQPEPPVAAEPEVTPAEVEPPPPLPATKPPPARKRRALDKPAPAKPAPASTLTEELKRLQQARAALRTGNAARARALIEAHRRDFPKSSVARERDATEIAALCTEHRNADAKRKAAAFAKAYPGAGQDLLADCDD